MMMMMMLMLMMLILMEMHAASDAGAAADDVHAENDGDDANDAVPDDVVANDTTVCDDE